MFAEFIELLFANYDVCGVLSGKMASQILCPSEHEAYVIVLVWMSSALSISFVCSTSFVWTLGLQMAMMLVKKAVASLQKLGCWDGTLRFGSLTTLSGHSMLFLWPCLIPCVVSFQKWMNYQLEQQIKLDSLFFRFMILTARGKLPVHKSRGAKTHNFALSVVAKQKYKAL